jgi:formylmethanofuran--tetrahydromethanopterin N-formyltransferase
VQIGVTKIIDTFAEAFSMRYCRVLVTAYDSYWLEAAVREFCGYSTSVIACDCEAGLERWQDGTESLDGRPGASILAFGFSAEALGQAVSNRTGQCIMTCPSTAAFNGLTEAGQSVPWGSHLRFFGDGYQKSKLVADRRFWRIPVMDGEFVVEERIGISKGVAGGNIVIEGTDTPSALEAARRAIDELAAMPGIITPFPAGIARSGSKVGSRYKALKASTSDAFCPTLRGRVDSQLQPETNCALEIVIDGIDEMHVRRAMRTAIQAAAGENIAAISAGNYGGKLGKYQLKLIELFNDI